MQDSPHPCFIEGSRVRAHGRIVDVVRETARRSCTPPRSSSARRGGRGLFAADLDDEERAQRWPRRTRSRAILRPASAGRASAPRAGTTPRRRAGRGVRAARGCVAPASTPPQGRPLQARWPGWAGRGVPRRRGSPRRAAPVVGLSSAGRRVEIKIRRRRHRRSWCLPATRYVPTRAQRLPQVPRPRAPSRRPSLLGVAVHGAIGQRYGAARTRRSWPPGASVEHAVSCSGFHSSRSAASLA